MIYESRESDHIENVYKITRCPEFDAPVVFDSPHSGTFNPKEFETVISDWDLQRVQDCYVDELFEDVTKSGASLLSALFLRSFIDPNRAPDDLDPALIQGRWPSPLKPSEKSRMGHGLIWRYFPAHRAMYTHKLTVEDVQTRLDKYWLPYQLALCGLLEAAYTNYGSAWHVNCHSMPAVSSPYATRHTHGKRVDIVIGDRNGRSCAPEFSDFCSRWFQNKGYIISRNDPYKGAYLIQAYAKPKQNIHSIQIEIKRSLYMNQATLEKRSDFRVLQKDLTQFAVDLNSFAQSHFMPRVAE